jgi:signal transduction histidine kinase/DNA-binding response OmpR family regulator
MPSNIERRVQPLFLKNNVKTNLLGLLGITEVWLDQSGSVWCLIGGRIYRFDEELKKFIQHKITIDGQVISDYKLVNQDRSGTWWFGTSNNGLIKSHNFASNVPPHRKPQYKQYKPKVGDPHNLNSDDVRSIYKDRQGYLWIGTDRGLNKFDIEAETFEHYSEKDGLPSNLISEISEDNQGNLWICTSKGLSRFNPVIEKFLNFDEQEGLPMAGFGECYAKGPEGEMYFGGRDGFMVFHPDSQQYNTHEPPVVITDFQIFNRSVLPGDQSPLKKSITHSTEIALRHDQDVFSFEFVTLDFTNPVRNQYAHKMEGVDPDWVYTNATRRYVTYTRLDPGEYLFRVKAANNEGVWNEAGAVLKITIMPPWWRTNLAYLIYILLVGSITYGIWRFRANRLKMQHRLELEQVHAAKLEELDQMKSRFFANISHEFRTPLTLILGPLEQMISGKLKKDVRDQYKIMRRNANRLLQLINQLLDLSKLEDGKLKLQAQKIEIVALLRGLVQAFESLAVLKNITLKFEPNLDAIELYVDLDKFEKIINNLLSNAFKFTPEGGKVTVSIGHPPQSPLEGGSKGGVYILVSNTGPDIPAEYLEKIFDRFYQAEDWEHEGSGIGLTLTKELVELHHGKIQVESIPGIRTTFSVFLPLGKEHLESDQIVESDYIERDGELREVVPSGERDTELVDGQLDDKRSKSAEKLPLILIVEDNIDLRRYLADIFKNDAKVVEAVNGEEGFNISIRQIPDLIISDVMMPKMDGFELCKKLKTDERTSHIPVILMTARAAKEDKLEGLETGADDYIAKPFEAEELLVRVSNLIEQRRLLRKRFTGVKGLRPQDIAVNSADQRFLQKALNIIERHLSDPGFGAERFSREMALSRVQLHRKLQALTDQSASEFARTIRLNRAAQLLREKTDNISQIAYEVGFSNPSHFSISFRKQFGLSPREYIKEQSSSN